MSGIVTIEYPPQAAKRQPMAESRPLGEPISLIVGAISAGIALVRLGMDAYNSWQKSNPTFPKPEAIVGPINSGELSTADAVAGHLASKFSALPQDVRVGYANQVWQMVQNKEGVAGKGFRKAAKQFPDLAPLVAQEVFGKPTFMEQPYAKTVIIAGSVTGAVLVGYVVYRIIKRRRGG